MKKLTLITVLLTLGLIVNAQKTVTTQNLIWLHYNGIVNLNKWKLDIEVEERSYIMPIRQHQLFLPRLTASYGINDKGFWHDVVLFVYVDCNAVRPNCYLPNYFSGKCSSSVRYTVPRKSATVSPSLLVTRIL